MQPPKLDFRVVVSNSALSLRYYRKSGFWTNPSSENILKIPSIITEVCTAFMERMLR